MSPSESVLSKQNNIFRYGLFFYCYGVYLHCGYEHSFISPHNGVINTSFQHYAHHARSSMNTPYHCGFFLTVWDEVRSFAAVTNFKSYPFRSSRLATLGTRNVSVQNVGGARPAVRPN